jgi:hypothetical protein
MDEGDRFRLVRGEIRLAPPRRQPSDEKIDRFIMRAGAARVLDRLDAMTAPTAVAAE